MIAAVREAFRPIVTDKRFAIAGLATFALLFAMLVPAQPAYADIAGDINKWLCGVLRDVCNWIFRAHRWTFSSP